MFSNTNSSFVIIKLFRLFLKPELEFPRNGFLLLVLGKHEIIELHLLSNFWFQIYFIVMKLGFSKQIGYRI